tara:strand:- start:2911 stop:3216 length:306 start_codon:yes stop_codon:yes gene_type:complete
MTTTESNKLIAEFMGWDIKNPTTIPTNLHLSNLELDNGEVMEFKYPTSWDWLMPVVEKCYEYGELHNEHREWIIETLSGIISINDTYRAVVEFIKYYNLNK